MSKSNKSAKEQLIKLYGEECFIEKLHLRQDTERKYKGKAQYHRMKQLTYHHIQEKCKGGKATIENGAILSAENHEWFNRQPKKEQERMNQAFQDYKRSVDLHCVNLRLTPKSIEIKPLQQDEEPIELPEEIERGYIELEPMTLEEQAKYEEYKRQRANRQYKKFGAVKKAHIDEKWQKEIIQDVLDELRY